MGSNSGCESSGLSGSRRLSGALGCERHLIIPLWLVRAGGGVGAPAHTLCLAQGLQGLARPIPPDFAAMTSSFTTSLSQKTAGLRRAIQTVAVII